MFEGSTVNGVLVSNFSGDDNDEDNVNQTSSSSPSDETNPREESFSFDNASLSEETTREILEGMIISVSADDTTQSEDTQANVGNTNLVSVASASSFGDQTILSSTASDIAVPEAEYHSELRNALLQVAGPRQPLPRQQHPLSISTASSVFMQVDEHGRSIPQVVDHVSLTSLSFEPTLLDSSFTLEPMILDLQTAATDDDSDASSCAASTLGNEQQLVAYDSSRRVTLIERVRGIPPALLRALNLVRPGIKNVDARPTGMHWYETFTEEDWEDFRSRANMVLRCLQCTSPTPRHHLRGLYRLPPLPPPQNAVEQRLLATTVKKSSNPSTFLPESFICSICNDAIVGALTLDCECGINVCMACWEYTSIAKRSGDNSAGYELASQLGFTVISSEDDAVGTCTESPQRCPSCSQMVHRPLVCNALDVAILQVVQNLDRKHFTFQRAYYGRLQQWRDEMERRKIEETENNEDHLCNEQIVAQLIQEEEQYWQQHNRATHRKSVTLPGTLSYVVAIIASIGIKLLIQNHQVLRNS